MPTEEDFEELAHVLDTHAGQVISVDELVTIGNHWLFVKKRLLPADRTLRDMARKAFYTVEQAAIAVVKTEIATDQRKACLSRS